MPELRRCVQTSWAMPIRTRFLWHLSCFSLVCSTLTSIDTLGRHNDDSNDSDISRRPFWGFRPGAGGFKHYEGMLCFPLPQPAAGNSPFGSASAKDEIRL